MINLTLKQLRYFEALAAMAILDVRRRPVRSRSRPCRCRSRNWRNRWARRCSSEARGRSGSPVRRRVRPARPRHPALGRRTGGLARASRDRLLGPAAYRHDPDDRALSAADGDRQSHAVLCRARHSRPRDGDAEADRRAGGGSARRGDRGVAGVRTFVCRGRAVSRRISCWSGRARTRDRRRRAAKRCAKCGCFCWKRAIVFAIRRCRSAICIPAAAGGAGRQFAVDAGPDGRRRHRRHSDPGNGGRVETRSASVSVARFENPQPSRTIGMIWRKTRPWPDSSCRFPNWFVSRPTRCASKTRDDRHRADHFLHSVNRAQGTFARSHHQAHNPPCPSRRT